MTIAETFKNPFNPDLSIQLNNRYWPGAKFEYINAISDAEAYLREGNKVQMARTLQNIKSPLFDGKNLYHILKRINKLEANQSSFGYITGQVQVNDDFLLRAKYSGANSRESYSVKAEDCKSFVPIIEEALRLYKSAYGNDFIRLNSNVRYARPDDRAKDISAYGQLSDLHHDESKGITTVVYLSEVREENGAFQFIPGSNEIPSSIVLKAIHQNVCFELLLNSPVEMGNLPLECRATPSYGDFLDDWKVKALSDVATTLEGPIGSYITFNGQNLLHRGGKPIKGERLALFLQPEGLLRLKARTLLTNTLASIQQFGLLLTS